MTTQHLDQLRQNPWANQLCYLVENLRLLKKNGSWFVIDKNDYVLEVSNKAETVMKWFLYCGNQSVSTALVYKTKSVMILGIFSDTKYFSLC